MTEEDSRMAAVSMSIDEGRRTASAFAARGAPWLIAYTVPEHRRSAVVLPPGAGHGLGHPVPGGRGLAARLRPGAQAGHRPDAGGPSPAAAGDPARHGADRGAARGDPAVRRSTGAGSGRAGRNRRKPPS